MAERQAAATIEDLLTCSLCLELFREPKTLTCLHSYCKACLNEMTTIANKHDSVLCPLCRDETAIPESGIDGLPTNFFIKNLLEVAELKSKNDSLMCSNCEDGLKAIARCGECDEFFCEKCVDAHNRLRPYQEHKVVDLKKLLSPSTAKEFHPAMKCPDHDNCVCKFYCRTCKVLICRDCTVVDHPLGSHSVANLKDVANQCREKSVEAMTKAEKHIARVKQVQHTCREKKEKFKTSVGKITAELNEKKEHLIQQFIQTIEGHSSKMISQLEQLLLDKAVPNETDEEQLESDLKKMGNYMLFMRNLLANGNDDEIMNMYDHLVGYVNDISGRNPFWLDDEDHATPTVSLQSEASDDILENSVDRLVMTCLGELIVPTLQADQFELVLEPGKVFDVGKDVEVHIRSTNHHGTPLSPLELQLFQAKVLTSKETVIKAKLQLHGEGTISVHFTSYIQGRHRLAVHLEGNSVRGSPLTLDVKGEPDYSPATSLLQKLPIEELGRKLDSTFWCDVQSDFVGNIYVLIEAAVIRVFDADLNPLYTINLPDVMISPWNFFINSEGQIVISDTGSHKLYVFQTDGTVLREIGKEGEGPGELKTPLGITVDSYDNIAVCDAGNRRIQLFNPDTSFKCSFGSEHDGEIMYPVSVVCNSQGHIIVAESSLWFSNYRPLPKPSGSFDEANAIECVKIFSRDGHVLQKFGEAGEGRGQFWAPLSIAVDNWNHIWVIDFTYGSIQVFDDKGIVKEVFSFKDKEKGAGWLSSITMASNGAVLYISTPL